MSNNQNQGIEEPNSTAQTNQNSEKNKSSGAEDQASPTAKTTAADASVETAKDTAKTVLNQAKDSASHAYELASEKATSKIDEQKSNLSSGLAGVADSIRQVGQTLRDSDEKNAVTDLTAKYGETIANQLEKVSGYFEKRDLKEIVRDAEVFARRQPAIFIAAAFATGLLAARFLKSSNDSIPRPHTKLSDESAKSNPRVSNTTVNQTAVGAS